MAVVTGASTRVSNKLTGNGRGKTGIHKSKFFILNLVLFYFCIFQLQLNIRISNAKNALAEYKNIIYYTFLFEENNFGQYTDESHTE